MSDTLARNSHEAGEQTPAATRPVKLTHDEAAARARELAPRLRERAAQAEALRRLPEETFREYAAAGLFHILQPARFGGSELDLRTLLEVGTELGRGCASSAWVYVVLASHAWMMSLFPEQAQEDLWGERPSTLISTSVAPRHQEIRRVPGGYQLSGSWGFSSGCDHANWVMVAATLPGEQTGGEPEPLWLLVPRPDYTILDDWFTVGLRGTGSKAISVADAFVPEHRTLNAQHVRVGRAPGRAVHRGPLYSVPLVAGLPVICIAPALGTAFAAYETWRDNIRTRYKAYAATMQAEQVPAQMRLAESYAQIAAAQTVIRRDLDEVMGTVSAGQDLSPAQRARMRMDHAYVIRLCTEAVDRLFAASGGSCIYDTHPMQRYWRDVHTIAHHRSVDWDDDAEAFARAELGFPPKSGYF
jgi:3-hydroxy-9,10-secoandrosta-1,3,5(10)-triene-9,17-dione monooxygenase